MPAATDGRTRYVREGECFVRLSASGAPGIFRTGIEGFNDGGDASAGTEVSYDFGPDRVSGFDDIVEDLVDDVLLEDAEVAVGEEIFLEALELHAVFVGHVADGETAEVGEAGLGADTGELRIVDEDLVGRELVRPGFDRGEFCIEPGCGVVVSVAGGVLRDGHHSILSGQAGVRTGAGKGCENQKENEVDPCCW